ncbi:MAG: hydroxyacid dehydrogenase [Burkholderiales bacterium]|nr:hydroxyacid dehydrogenase [Burkholderiales bacterium]
MKVVIPEFILPESLERLGAIHDVVYDPGLVGERQRLVDIARDADAIIVRRLTQVRGDLLDAMVRLKAVGRLGVGLDNIDVAACRARGIEVIPATGANAGSVAEYVIACTLLLVRGAFFATEDVIAGAWPKPRLDGGREVRGLTLGVVGFGSIGRATAALAHGLGMAVIACGRPGRVDALLVDGVTLVPFEQLLAASDVVSLHLPLTSESAGLFGARTLAAMKRGAVLVNAARGGIVDDRALVEALRSGHLGGAAVDAFEAEPLGPSPMYAGVPNLVLTPHIAGVTRQSERRVNRAVVDRVLAALAR